MAFQEPFFFVFTYFGSMFEFEFELDFELDFTHNLPLRAVCFVFIFFFNSQILVYGLTLPTER